MFNDMAQKAIYLEVGRIAMRYMAAGLITIGAPSTLVDPLSAPAVAAYAGGFLAFGVELAWAKAKNFIR